MGCIFVISSPFAEFLLLTINFIIITCYECSDRLIGLTYAFPHTYIHHDGKCEFASYNLKRTFKSMTLEVFKVKLRKTRKNVRLILFSEKRIQTIVI